MNQTWIFPSNQKKFDVNHAFEEFPSINWRQRVHVQVGDTIYIYCTHPYQRIMYQTVVTEIDIPYSDSMNDTKYWNTDVYKENYKYDFFCMKLVKSIDSDRLSLNNLKKHGLKKAPQSAMYAFDPLASYIAKVFDHTSTLKETNFLPEELDETASRTYLEGSKKKITVNAYERNPKARKDCLRIHGSKCFICGFDFSSFYGSEFAGRIHVHHLIPLHNLKQGYEVDPAKDLVPVCPNCHMVLHLKPDGVYTVDEVKKMITQQKKCN